MGIEQTDAAFRRPGIREGQPATCAARDLKFAASPCQMVACRHDFFVRAPAAMQAVDPFHLDGNRRIMGSRARIREVRRLGHQKFAPGASGPEPERRGPRKPRLFQFRRTTLPPLRKTPDSATLKGMRQAQDAANYPVSPIDWSKPVLASGAHRQRPRPSGRVRGHAVSVDFFFFQSEEMAADLRAAGFTSGIVNELDRRQPRRRTELSAPVSAAAVSPIAKKGQRVHDLCSEVFPGGPPAGNGVSGSSGCGAW